MMQPEDEEVPYDEAGASSEVQTISTDRQSIGGCSYEFDVANPEVLMEKRSPYIIYTIFVKVVNLSGKLELYNVQRRYSEFDWIRERLASDHPGCIVPPLPEKTIFQRIGKKVIDERLVGLKKFIEAVAKNPILAEDENFQKFIKLNRINFMSFLASNKRSTLEDISKNIEDAINDTLLDNFEETNERYDQLKRNLLALSQSSGHIRSSFEKVLAASAEVSNSRSDLTTNIESHKEESLELSMIYQKLPRTQTEIIVGAADFSSALLKHSQPFGFYEKMAASVADAMKSRFANLVRFYDLEKTLEEKTQKLQQAKSEGKSQAIQKLTQEVEEITRLRNFSYEVFIQAQNSLEADLELFYIQKERDLIVCAHQVASEYGTFHSQNAMKWKALLSEIQEL